MSRSNGVEGTCHAIIREESMECLSLLCALAKQGGGGEKSERKHASYNDTILWNGFASVL